MTAITVLQFGEVVGLRRLVKLTWICVYGLIEGTMGSLKPSYFSVSGGRSEIVRGCSYQMELVGEESTPIIDQPLHLVSGYAGVLFHTSDDPNLHLPEEGRNKNSYREWR